MAVRRACLLMGLVGCALALMVVAMGQEGAEPAGIDESTVDGEGHHAGAEGMGHEGAAGEHEDGMEHREHVSRWHDRVHCAGIGSGFVALLAVVLAIAIALRHAKGKGIVARMKARKWHILAGLGAIGLAWGHAIGRAVQEGEMGMLLEPEGPQLLALLFVLIGLSGLARHRPFGALQSRPAVAAWLHRAAFAAMFVLLALHALGEYAAFNGGGS